MSALKLIPWLVCLAVSCQATDEWQPEQIHISYGEGPSEMVVTWNTAEEVGSVVFFGQSRPDTRAVGRATRFVDGGELRRAQYVHRATMPGLKPNTSYVYQVGSEAGWSELFAFTSMAAGVDWSPRLAVYGDMGSENAQSLPRLQRETQQGLYDAVLHVGDFAYDMDTDNAEVGDAFMRQLEPIAGYLPYMTCPGNHEQRYNFSNYKNRFTMPRAGDNMYYSFDMGPVHFVSVSSEYYYYLNYGLKMVGNQFKWLEKDLEEASRPDNRARRPWLVVFGHRPMYCSDNNTDDCTRQFDAMRVGLPVLHMYGMEELLMRYGVDLAVWAHEHSYERLWPVYNNTVYNGTDGEPYHNPGAPVHIVTGSASPTKVARMVYDFLDLNVTSAQLEAVLHQAQLDSPAADRAAAWKAEVTAPLLRAADQGCAHFYDASMYGAVTDSRDLRPEVALHGGIPQLGSDVL